MTTDAEGHPHWQRNLGIAMFGAFTTVLATTLLVPFLPLYVETLGVHGHEAVAEWSAIAFGATFLSAGLTAPLWGMVADRFGRKIILVRASLGMAVCIALTGMVHSIGQLVAIRLLTGLVGGYGSGALILVATQTPKARSGWALGLFASATTAGTLFGPLAGGIMPGLVGIRATFFVASALIAVAFVATVLFIREPERPVRSRAAVSELRVPDRALVAKLLVLSSMVTIANFSIEPVIPIYAAHLLAHAGEAVVLSPHATFLAGLVMAASALGSVVASPRIGHLSDRIGRARVLTASLLAGAVLLIPQAFVTAGWQLVILRFLMGVALAGLLPGVNAMLRHAAPAAIAGRVMALGTSAFYAGQVAGPLIGGFVFGESGGGMSGLRTVFFITASVMLLGAGIATTLRQRA
ncbi:MFS transporter [Tanticharoenia sakaeratensis]|uniref:Major facilitator superfamily MFS_1 n=1 Tax=Tanticharoenia sakaeratensis NBRC 103193 TaxID=1231623 RepID=A0A0D6MJC6_9PROT|nr:MFS transporter [Tanticharoenia sakaeratensis]GAN53739.1 major facilitator superfamily MFS_1 [Tanticharoenia sakaeratensis NBRC 103193]GBQ17051.1 major facilitator family transporter [Tanticharoenia sakaeratensis NBRC 103193]